MTTLAPSPEQTRADVEPVVLLPDTEVPSATPPARSPLISDEYPRPKLTWAQKCELYPNDWLVRLSNWAGEAAIRGDEWVRTRVLGSIAAYGQRAIEDWQTMSHDLSEVLDKDRRR